VKDNRIATFFWGFFMDYPVTVPKQVSITEIPEGIEGTKMTVEEMAKEAEKGALNWTVISITREITKNKKSRDYEAIADEIFWWVKKNIKFNRDPVPAELIQSPEMTIKVKTGDCDDMVILLDSMMQSVGIPTRYVTISYLPDAKDDYTHVYLEALVSKENQKAKWKPYDASVPNSTPGWKPPKYYKMGIWEPGGKYRELAGFFDDLVDSVKQFANNVEEEYKRVEDDIKEERDRTIRRMAEEFQRFGTKMKEDWKMGAFSDLIMKGLIAPPFSLLSEIVRSDFRLKVTEDDWLMFAQITASLGGTVFSLLTPIIGTSAISLILSAVGSFASIQQNINQKKDLAKQLEDEMAQSYIEERARREIINKSLADAHAMEDYLVKKKQLEFDLISFRAQWQEKVKEENDRLEAEYKKEIEEFKMMNHVSGLSGYEDSVVQRSSMGVAHKSDVERYVPDWTPKYPHVFPQYYIGHDFMREQAPWMRYRAFTRQRNDIGTVYQNQVKKENPYLQAIDNNILEQPWTLLSGTKRFKR